MDWRKVTSKDRDNAREEFRRLVIEATWQWLLVERESAGGGQALLSKD
jgi:hypothetical protein